MAMPAPEPFFVAIAGGSGSGKTTLAHAVQRVLGEQCVLVAHDAYYRCLAHLPPEQRAKRNFDHPDSLENELLALHIAQLRGGKAIELPSYDFATHTRLPQGTATLARPVVLVEGILVLSVPQLRRSFDLRVFVDAPTEVRFRRRCSRDVHERGRTEASVRAQWLETVQPMHERFVAPCQDECDLVVSGREDLRTSASRVVSCVTAQRRATFSDSSYFPGHPGLCQ